MGFQTKNKYQHNSALCPKPFAFGQGCSNTITKGLGRFFFKLLVLFAPVVENKNKSTKKLTCFCFTISTNCVKQNSTWFALKKG